MGVQYFFVYRLEKSDLEQRSGPEFDDPSRGGYKLDRVDLQDGGLLDVDLKPAALKEFILANDAALADAVCIPMTPSVETPRQGELVRVRGEHWVVVIVDYSRQPVDELAATRLPGRTLVKLMAETVQQPQITCADRVHIGPIAARLWRGI